MQLTVQWLSCLNLNINFNKTKLIQFRNYKTKHIPINITVNNIKIEEVDKTNFLGVTIDPYLNWKAHIEKINSKISRSCYLLSVLSDIADKQTVKNAYYGYVFPLLKYGIIYWGNSVNVQSTFILQKRCIRTIYRLRQGESLRNIFRENNLLTVTGIYILELALFVKNNMEYFTSKSKNREERVRSQHKHDLKLPRIRNTTFKKSTLIAAIQVYNKLPHNIKCLEGNRFKNSLSKWLNCNVFYNLNEFFSFK